MINYQLSESLFVSLNAEDAEALRSEKYSPRRAQGSRSESFVAEICFLQTRLNFTQLTIALSDGHAFSRGCSGRAKPTDT